MRYSRRVPSILFAFAVLAGTAHSGARPAQSPAETPVYNGTLRVKAYLSPFNPNFDPSGSPHFFIVEQLFDGLVKVDGNFNIIPGLAEYWTISGDQKRITFYIRRGVKFHDGRELTSEDVKFSLDRLVQNRPGNPCYEYFINKVVGAEAYWKGEAPDVSGFRVVDRYTFEIEWLRPYSQASLYLLSMSFCKILPKDLLTAQGRRFFQAPIGTGPFKFAYFLRGPQLDILGVRLIVNGAYYGKRPYLMAIEYSPEYSENQFDEGVVHIFPVTTPRLLRDNHQVLENTTLRTCYLAMSCRTAPLDRADVRMALALGLNKAALAAAAATTSSLTQVTENFIPPLLPGFFPRETAAPCEPEKARVLLARLLPETAAKPLKLTLVFPAQRTEAWGALARELGKELGALGIETETKYLKADRGSQDVAGPYLKLIDWTMAYPDPENIVMPLFHSLSSANALAAQYANPTVDRLAEQAEVEPSWEKRTALFRRIEKILFDDLPAVPLYTEKIRIVLQSKVRGATLPATGFYSLDTKAIWLKD